MPSRSVSRAASRRRAARRRPLVPEGIILVDRLRPHGRDRRAGAAARPRSVPRHRPRSRPRQEGHPETRADRVRRLDQRRRAPAQRDREGPRGDRPRLRSAGHAANHPALPDARARDSSSWPGRATSPRSRRSWPPERTRSSPRSSRRRSRSRGAPSSAWGSRSPGSSRRLRRSGASARKGSRASRCHRMPEPIERSPLSGRRRRRGAAPAARAVLRIASSSCAVDTNQASNCAGGRDTPRSRMAWKKAA